MNRGSPGAQDNRAIPRNCFNEAPIHESGKSWNTSYTTFANSVLQ